MPALQSTNPASCAWLKWAKALDTSCFQADNRSGQDMSVLLDNEADMHFLIIIADHSCSCLLFPPKTLYLKARGWAHVPMKGQSPLLKMAEHTIDSFGKSIRLHVCQEYAIEKVKRNTSLEPEYAW